MPIGTEQQLRDRSPRFVPEVEREAVWALRRPATQPQQQPPVRREGVDLSWAPLDRIRAEDLAAARFDRVWAAMQC